MAKDYRRIDARHTLRAELDEFVAFQQDTSEPSIPRPTLEDRAIVEDTTADDGTKGTYGNVVLFDLHEQPGLHMVSPGRKRMVRLGRPCPAPDEKIECGDFYREKAGQDIQRGYHLA